ncbi:MAG: ABC transporter ATP-binding protein/permease [Clostridia bacterium]|nr:ABC transporter ATP-binding protein/permease [Clostridia bacterium]
MANNYSTPPSNMNGIQRPGRGMVVVKPKNLKGTLIRLWKTTAGHRKGLGWILLLSILASATAILSPFLSGKAITLINNGDPVNIVLLSLLIIYISEWLNKTLQQFIMAKTCQNIIHHIRMGLIQKTLKLPLSFFDKHQHGELMSRLTNDIDNISTTISNSLSLLFTYFFTIIGIFIMMVSLNPLLTLVSIVGIVAIFILTKFITSRTKKLFKERQVNLGALNGHIEEGISGITVVKAFSREEKMQQEFEEKNDKLCKTSIDALIYSGYLMPLTNVINNICFLLIAVFSGIMYLNNVFEDIGLITTFLLYIRQFNRPFVEIANIYNNFQTAVAGAERIFEIIDQDEEPADAKNAIKLENAKGDIEFKNVSFEYKKDYLILDDFSLKIKAGTQVAIVGPTGSGKTTIINLLTRFYDVTSGEITIDGHKLEEYTMKSLRETFGVVLQDSSLFASTVKDNIAYGHDNATFEEIVEAAELSGADSFINRLENKYDTLLEQGGLELSQGERQLITISRAVIAKAPIIILDEATSSVDTVTEQKIKRAMVNMCKGKTSFIIAHRLATIRDSDIILFIEKGKIIEQGSHDELIKLNGKYAQLYLTQTGAI